MTGQQGGRSYEVEAKFRIGDLAEVIAALTARKVILSAPSLQDDQAYAPASWSYGMSKIGVSFARLRTEDQRHLFTVKKPIHNEMACQEHETFVDDRAEMHAALVTMGWIPTVRIVKQRQVGLWDQTSVCVDVVDGLGAFVELERMAGIAESGEQIQAGLDAMIRTLGVPVQRITDTYDTLLRSLTDTAR